MLLRRQFTTGPIFRAVHYGTGRGWVPAGTGAPHEGDAPLLLQGGLDQTGVDFADLNSDGVTDIVWSRKHPDGSSFAGALFNKSRAPQGRLNRVLNGYDVAVEVEYDSLLNPLVYTKGTTLGPIETGEQAFVANVTGPRYVVRKLLNDNGKGAMHQLVYSYEGLRLHRLRGSLGFEKIRVFDVSRNTNVLTINNQNYPLFGQEGLVTVYQGSGNGSMLSQTMTTWASKLQNPGVPYQPRIVYASESQVVTYDPVMMWPIATSTTTTGVPDDYGNILTLSSSSGDGYSKATTNTYHAADVTNWILGRLATAQVASSGGSFGLITRQSSFTYRGDGLLFSETVQPGDPHFALTTTYAYDGFGNRTSATVSGPNLTVGSGGEYSVNGTVSRSTSTLYDSLGRFPISSTNAIGQTESYANNQIFGVVSTLTGPNGLVTTWLFDGFGRKTDEIRSDGIVSTTRYKWTPAGSLSGSLFVIESESSGSAPSRAHYNAIGQLRWSESIDAAGRIVYQETSYDALGRVLQTSIPYLNNGSTVYWAGTGSYDVLDRPITTYTPDDQNGQQTISYQYWQFTTTVTDPKGRKTQSVRNASGWVTSVIRNVGASSAANDYSAVNHEYDGLGNLRSTIASGATTSLTYDVRGRKTEMVEPNMGSWSYRYNAFSELIWQRDARGQIVEMNYDALGRLVYRRACPIFRFFGNRHFIF